jgi:radical SAM superfamily enzyme YgiQ (UPF0313 family)
MGFDVGLFFILGLPYETKTDAEKSLSLAKKYPVKYAKFHICIPYPGTKLSKWIDDNNLWYMEPSEYLDSFDYADLLVTYDNKGMTRDQILYYIKKSIKIDAFIRMKYAANRMSKKLPKWAADFIAGIIYHPLYFSRLRRMARQKGWIRIRNATAITLKLDN